MAKCPLIGWELLKLQNILTEYGKVKEAGAVAIEIAKSFMADIFLGPFLDAMQNGVDIYDSMVDKINDILGAISPASWQMYAIAATAKEALGAAMRERDIMRTGIALISSLDSKSDRSLNKYKDISRKAMSNVQRIRGKLSLAESAKTAESARRLILEAAAIADSNRSLLAGDVVAYRKAYNESQMASSVSASVTSGKIKPLQDAAANIALTIADMVVERARKEAIDKIGSYVTRLGTLARLLYMFTGINYLRPVGVLSERYNAILGNIRFDRDDAFVVLGIPHEIDMGIKDLRREIKELIAEIQSKMAINTGLYYISMSPDYDILDRAIGWSGGTGAYAAVGTAMMSVSPYSDVPNESLTSFGASASLYESLTALKVLVANMSPAQSEGASPDQEESLAGVRGKIARLLDGESLDESNYEFDDALDMASARVAANSGYTGVKGVLRESQSPLRDETNMAAMEKARGVSGINGEISEPAMSIAVVLRIVIPYLIPTYNSKATIKDMVAAMSARTTYLDRVINILTPIAAYRDDSVESVLDMLESSGFADVAKAAKYGQIVSGAVSVAAALAGGTAMLYDVFSSCVIGSPLAKKNNHLSMAGLNKIKTKAKETVNAAINKAMEPLGYNMSLIDNIQNLERRRDAAIGNMAELKKALETSISNV